MPSWSPRPLVLAAALTAAAAPSALAVIIPSGGSAEKDRLMQARSHQVGAAPA